MFEQTKRISFRISYVLSKVEPEPGAGPLHRLRSTESDLTKLLMQNSNN